MIAHLRQLCYNEDKKIKEENNESFFLLKLK